MLIDTIESEQSTPSLSHAQRMKKLSQRGELNDDVMLSIMTEIKKLEKNEILSERYQVERLDEIVDIASEALCSKRSSFSLCKDTYPYALVKDRLLRLDSSHIEYILDCIDGNTTNIHNIKPYLLKTLINAPAGTVCFC